MWLAKRPIDGTVVASRVALVEMEPPIGPPTRSRRAIESHRRVSISTLTVAFPPTLVSFKWTDDGRALAQCVPFQGFFFSFQFGNPKKTFVSSQLVFRHECYHKTLVKFRAPFSYPNSYKFSYKFTLANGVVLFAISSSSKCPHPYGGTFFLVFLLPSHCGTVSAKNATLSFSFRFDLDFFGSTSSLRNSPFPGLVSSPFTSRGKKQKRIDGVVFELRESGSVKSKFFQERTKAKKK